MRTLRVCSCGVRKSLSKGKALSMPLLNLHFPNAMMTFYLAAEDDALVSSRKSVNKCSTPERLLIKINDPFAFISFPFFSAAFCQQKGESFTFSKKYQKKFQTVTRHLINEFILCLRIINSFTRNFRFAFVSSLTNFSY